MKLTKYFMPLAAIALLASCSDDKIVDQPDQPKLDLSKETYMDVKIVLPTTDGSRADGFNDLNTGSAQEYAIQNGYIYLFKKDVNGNDLNQTLQAYGPLELEWGTPEQENTSKEISATATLHSLVENKDFAESFYGILILNQNSEAITEPKPRDTYQNWCTSAQPGKNMMYFVTSSNDGGSTSTPYFTMTNALGWVGTPSTEKATPSVDVVIDKSYVYQEGTTGKGPVTFYVQRGVSKVSMAANQTYTVGAQTFTALNSGSRSSKDEIKLKEWGLGVTNNTTYPVQKAPTIAFPQDINWLNLSTSTPWKRFINSNGQDTEFTRVHWAEDPNYSSTGTLVNLTSYAKDPKNTATVISDNTTPAYCLENTFNLDNMIKNQSTRIVFKGQYKAAYLDKTPGDYDEDTDNGGDFVANGDRTYRLVNTSKSNSLSSGRQTLDDVVVADELEDAMAALGVLSSSTVNFYKGGVVYYTIINRHFANNELEDNSFSFTNWTIPEGLYGTDEAHYLGRYGMVRNNWYEIRINTISGPGEPTIPTPDTSTDDDPKPYYMDVTVKVLSWAKRSHGYDIK